MTVSMSSMPLRRVLMAGVTAALAALSTLGLSGCEDRKTAAIRDVSGQEAPELVATTRDGTPVQLADLRGKVVVVNFWLAECGPCLAEMPDFDAVYKAHKDQGLEVLGINMGQPEATVDNAARRIGVSFPLLSDPLKISSERYNVLAAPTSFIIGPDGRLVERVNGPMNKDDLVEKIGPLLSRSS